MKANAKTIKCSCGGTFKKKNIVIQGIKSDAMVCSCCEDIVFTVKQSEKYHFNKEKILKEIIDTIPEEYRSLEIEMLIANHLHKGTEYVLSTVKYAFKRMDDEFIECVAEALKNDYARHDRQVEKEAIDKLKT